MPPFVRILLYGLGVFAIFMIIALILKLCTNSTPEGADYFGLFTSSDLWLGLAVAAVVTITHIRKKKIKEEK